MSFDRKKEAGLPATVLSAETMLGAIEALGIVPFFENPILGYSIEEMTARENWFDGQEDLRLTPWDWKIPCVQSGDVAYGKFLWGGKAAFATVEWYAELMNWRRSQAKYQPLPDQQRVLEYLAEHGSIGIKVHLVSFLAFPNLLLFNLSSFHPFLSSSLFSLSPLQQSCLPPIWSFQ